MIEIIDNVFDEKTVDILYGHFRDYDSWFFTGEGRTGTNWRKFIINLDYYNKTHEVLYKKADEIFKRTLPHLINTHSLDRPYASGYLYGTHHEMHTDGKDENDCFTIMFYLNKIWDMSYAGETIYTDPTRTEIIKSVIPKPGRVAVFNGFIPHCAREVSRTCVELRMVATFKYRRDTVANHWKEKLRRENES